MKKLLLPIIIIFFMSVAFAPACGAENNAPAGAENKGFAGTDSAPFDTTVSKPWPAFHHDSRRTGASPYAGAALPYVRWRFATGSPVTASPAVDSDGTIYIGSWNGWFYALNNFGLLKWRYKTGNIIRSSAAIADDGTVYVGSNDTYLYAFDRRGTLLWKYKTGGAVVSSPAVGSDGTVFFGSADNYVYALNSDGSPAWRFAGAGAGVDSSPALGADGRVYIGSWDRYVYGLNQETGEAEWIWPFKAWFFPEDEDAYCFYGGIFASPAVAPDGSLYVANDTMNRGADCAPDDDYYYFRITPCGTVSAPSVCGANFQLSLGDYDVYSTAAVRDDASTYLGYGSAIAHVLPDGVLDWSYLTGGKVDSSPALDVQSSVFAGSADRRMYCLSGAGSLLWKFETYGRITSSPAIDPGGSIVFGSEDGSVYSVGGSLCPLSIFFQGEEKSLGPFRTFRDRLLQTSPAGLFFVNAYYRFAGEIITILSADPALQGRVLAAAEFLLSRLSQIENGGDVQIPEAVMMNIKGCLSDMSAAAGPELRGVIEKLSREVKQKKWFNEMGFYWE